MKDDYKTGKVEGSNLIHIIDSYNNDVATSILCRSLEQKNITIVDKNPTCPKCINTCLVRLNIIKPKIAGYRVISEAYRQIFGTNVRGKSRCRELHREIRESNRNFPYIPNSCTDIAIYLDEAFYHITKEKNIIKNRDSRPQLRFLDAGCGIGNIVALANAAGFIAHGIEINSEYLKIARRLTTNMNAKPYFKCADIITFDKYHLYDLIYYYVPIADQNWQAAFEVHLIRGMKVGAYMLPTGSTRCINFAVNEKYFEKHNLKNCLYPVFEKIREVPKNWISENVYLKEEYKRYVSSIKTKKGDKN